MPAAEKAEAAAPPAAPAPAKQALFSPTGAIIVFVLLVLEGVGVFLIAKNFGASKEGASVDGEYVEVDIGSFDREIRSSTVETAVPRTFSMKVQLVLNSNLENVQEVKGEVEKKKNLLRARVYAILNGMNPDYFRQQNASEDLSSRLKQQLNLLLKSKDGHDKIDKVIFSEWKQPENP